MNKDIYLFDTHALIFWNTKEGVTSAFISFFDKEEKKGNVLVSSISFWEAALLAKKGKIEIEDMQEWKRELLNNSNLILIDPTASEMIDSTLLPDHHKDPFDRLLISQAKNRKAQLVTKDGEIKKYSVPTCWIG